MKTPQINPLTQTFFNHCCCRFYLLAFVLLSCQAVNAQVTKYTAIIDAGSSGSRIYVYEVITSGGEKKLPDKINELFSEKTSPGLSSLINYPKLALGQLEKLLTPAKLNLEKKVQIGKKIPLYLMATAGMRLVTPDQQQQLMQQIKAYFSDDPIFDFREALVLSGRYEGLYSWLAANYLSNRLRENNSSEIVIEMGGASMQISKEQVADYSTVTRKIPAHKNPIEISAHSFLGLGQSQALELMLKKNRNFFKKNISFKEAKGKIKNMLKARYTAAERARKQIANALTTKLTTYKTLIEYFRNPTKEQAIKILDLPSKPSFHYDKNLLWTKMIKKMQQLSDTIKKTEFKIIGFARTEASFCLCKQPKFDSNKHKIIAVSAFYHTLKFFKLLSKKDMGKFTLQALADTGKTVYKKGWENLKKENKFKKLLKKMNGNKSAAEARLQSYYFNLAYFHFLFKTLFDFKGKNIPLYSLKKIKDSQTSIPTEPTWTLGAVIDLELGNSPEKH